MGYTSRVGNIVGCNVSFWLVTFAAFAGRMWVRIKKRSLWWDDWLIVASMLLITGKTLTTCCQIIYGVGYHIEDLPPMEDRMLHLLVLWYIDQIEYILCVGIVKLSILCFYLRISRELRIPVFITLAFVTCVTIATTFTVVFQCIPVSYMWDKKQKPPGRCVNMTHFWVSSASLNIVGDFIVYILPIRTLWKVQLPTRERIGIVAVFAAGAAVVVIGIVRLHSLTIISQSEDITWVNIPSELWSTAELELGVICACLPALKQLFGKVLGFTKASLSSGGTSGHTGASCGVAGTAASHDQFRKGSNTVYPISVTDTVLEQIAGYKNGTGVDATVDAGGFDDDDSSKENLFDGDTEGKIVKTTDFTVTMGTA